MRLLILTTLGASGVALAAPGDHIRPSESTVITPSVALGFDYRTNVYRSEDEPTPAGSLMLQPGLELGVDTEQVNWKFGGSWTGRKFLFVGEPPADSTSLDAAQRIANLDRFNQFQAGTSLDVFREEPVGIVLDERATLINNNADADLARGPFTTQIRNAVSGGLRASPGPALDILIGGQHDYDDFKVPGVEGQSSFNSRNTYGPLLDVKWRFFPRTALIFGLEYNVVRWRDTVVAPDEGESFGGLITEIALPNSTQLKARTGIQGRFTEKLDWDFLVGYGFANYDEASAETTGINSAAAVDVTGLDGLLIATEARYEFVDSARLSIGYRKDFIDSFFSNFVAYQYIYGGLALDVGRWSPAVNYGTRIESYQGFTTRDDILNRLTVDNAINVTDYATIDLGFWWQQRASVDTTVEYDDWNMHVGATFTY